MHSWFDTTPPPNFQAAMHAAGCYCTHEGKILFLKRHPNKPYGKTWGVPGGKIEKGETPLKCMLRELYEETAISLTSSSLHRIETIFCRIPQLDYTFTVFYAPLRHRPFISLGNGDEHTEYVWVTDKEARQLPLIAGGREILTFFSAYIATNN